MLSPSFTAHLKPPCPGTSLIPSLKRKIENCKHTGKTPPLPLNVTALYQTPFVSSKSTCKCLIVTINEVVFYQQSLWSYRSHNYSNLEKPYPHIRRLLTNLRIISTSAFFSNFSAALPSMISKCLNSIHRKFHPHITSQCFQTYRFQNVYSYPPFTATSNPLRAKFPFSSHAFRRRRVCLFFPEDSHLAAPTLPFQCHLLR